MSGEALTGLLENFKAILFELCTNQADRELLESVIHLNAEDGSSKIMAEVRRLGVQNVSERMLSTLGFERRCLKRASRTHGAVWGLERI